MDKANRNNTRSDGSHLGLRETEQLTTKRNRWPNTGAEKPPGPRIELHKCAGSLASLLVVSDPFLHGFPDPSPATVSVHAQISHILLLLDVYAARPEFLAESSTQLAGGGREMSFLARNSELGFLRFAHECPGNRRGKGSNREWAIVLNTLGEIVNILPNFSWQLPVQVMQRLVCVGPPEAV